MIASIHLADIGTLAALDVIRQTPRAEGLRFASTVTATPLPGRVAAVPGLRRVGLVALWDDDAALTNFLAVDPIAETLAPGWQLRLEPVRVSGAFTGIDAVTPEPVDGPVAVLTLGRTRVSRLGRFRRSSAPAEARALSAPGFRWGTAFARLPFLGTCSLWRDARAVTDYAYGPGAHRDVIAADRAEPFHRSSAFVRFRPYRCEGRLGGRNPVSADVVAKN